VGIGKVLKSGDLIEGLDARYPGLLQRIIGLFPEKEERAEPELMAERAVHRVEQARRPRRVDLQERRRQERQPHVQEYNHVEQGQVMTGETVIDPVAEGDALPVADALLICLAA